MNEQRKLLVDACASRHHRQRVQLGSLAATPRERVGGAVVSLGGHCIKPMMRKVVSPVQGNLSIQLIQSALLNNWHSDQVGCGDEVCSAELVGYTARHPYDRNMAAFEGSSPHPS